MSKKEKTQMPDLNWIGYGRTMCSVLEEMRKCVQTLNFAPLPFLIEEVQMMGNRMEDALQLGKRIDDIDKDFRLLKKARKELIKEVEELIKKRDKLEDD